MRGRCTCGSGRRGILRFPYAEECRNRCAVGNVGARLVAVPTENTCAGGPDLEFGLIGFDECDGIVLGNRVARLLEPFGEVNLGARHAKRRNKDLLHRYPFVVESSAYPNTLDV